MKLLIAITILLSVFNTYAQNDPLIINPYINLPKDSIESALIISSLNDFLISAEGPNEDNKFIVPTERMETFLLLDEIKGIDEYSNGAVQYSPHLMNVVALEDQHYLVQVSYMALDENIPILRASFDLVARNVNDRFLFASPLRRNTRHWNTMNIGNNTFHFKSTLNESNAKEYEMYSSQFDSKLNSTNKTTEFYCAKDLVELLDLIGVQYKMDYNGMSRASTSSIIGDKKLVVLGNDNSHFDNFDPHDLWHDRLSRVISRNSVNKPIDEACAYLYGGSWGLTWEQIFDTFKIKVANNKNVDWKNLKENPLNFGVNRQEHLMADYVVNALIVQMLEREKGFDAVWEFLNCGKYEAGNDNYYKSLKKLTGISKSNYNEMVWELINSES